MELTCKVRHWVWNNQQADAILTGQPKKADLSGAIEPNIIQARMMHLTGLLNLKALIYEK